jgi:hypothetical protein
VMPDIWIDNLRTLEDSVPPIPVAQVSLCDLLAIFDSVRVVLKAAE